MKLIYVGTTTKYDVQVSAIKENVIQVIGSKLPMKEKGFVLIDEEENEYDYSAYSTLYRDVESGYQYSNNGEIWVEPTKEVKVFATWVDDDNILKKRPSSIKVDVLVNEVFLEQITLKGANNWEKAYSNIPVSDMFTVATADVEDYTKDIVDTIITFTLKKPYEPSVEEQLVELTDMVVDLDERVYALEEG